MHNKYDNSSSSVSFFSASPRPNANSDHRFFLKSRLVKKARRRYLFHNPTAYLHLHQCHPTLNSLGSIFDDLIEIALELNVLHIGTTDQFGFLQLSGAAAKHGALVEVRAIPVQLFVEVEAVNNDGAA